MALVWNWKDKCGEMCVIQSHPDEEDQKYTVALYQGNAYLRSGRSLTSKAPKPVS